MTIVTVGDAGLDMTQLNATLARVTAASASVVSESSTTYVLNAGEGDILTVSGSGLSFNGDYLIGGTVTGLADTHNGVTAFQATGLSIPASSVANWGLSGQADAALQSILGGDDQIVAPNSVANVLFGFLGNDSISGGSGADTIDGGAGDDSIDGNAGNDSIVAASGRNTFIRAGGGNDVVIGGSGADTINGNIGDDTIYGHSAAGETLFGGQGNDLLDATQSTGHDNINGNRGDDTVLGGSGGDTLYGGQGNDQVTGGGGGDWLSGDLGQNTLTGGGGADVFHVGPGHDVVTDFHSGEGDRIQVDAGTTWTPTQAGADVHIVFSDGGDMTLQNVQLGSLPPGWIFTE